MKKTPPKGRLVTVSEAVALSGKSRCTLYRYIKAKRIKRYYKGPRVMFLRQQVAALAD